MFGFSIRNAFRRKGIAFFSILGTALGCALMTVLLGISDGMDKRMNETMTDLAGGITVYSQDAPMGFLMGGGTPLPESYVDEIESLEHVKSISPAVFAFVPTSVVDFGDPMGVTLMGVDLERDEEGEGATTKIVDGRSMESGDELIVGAVVARYTRQAGLEAADVGSTFKFPTKQGPIELKIVGEFKTGNNYFDSYIYSSMATARKIAGLSEGEISNIMLEADSTDEVQNVATAIEAMFEDSEVPVTARVATDILEEISGTMDIFKGFLWIISLVAAIAGGVSIFIVMLMSVMERTKEFGILKASGWSNGNIIGSVVLQSITIALVGAIVGLAIGYVGAQGVDEYIGVDIGIITVKLVAIIAAFGISVGLVGGVYPALRATRVSPIESLRAM